MKWRKIGLDEVIEKNDFWMRVGTVEPNNMTELSIVSSDSIGRTPAFALAELGNTMWSVFRLEPEAPEEIHILSQDERRLEPDL